MFLLYIIVVQLANILVKKCHPFISVAKMYNSPSLRKRYNMVPSAV